MQTRLIPVSSLPRVMDESWVDRTRRPFIAPEGAYVPVCPGYHATHTIPDRQRRGRGYQKMGDVIAFHGNKPLPSEIDDVLVREHPRGIIWIEGHHGSIRIPRITLLYGSAGEVVHRESGIEYRFDVEKVMFSQGNREEKRRVASLVIPGERVGDMFAGIGYFSLGMAGAGADVHAMEINPVSCRYLHLNVISNKLEDRVRISPGDCRSSLSGIYDRIHMGHYDAVDFLADALKHVRDGTWLHVHMLGDRTSEIAAVIRSSGYDADITLFRVKKAGPRVWHQVADVVIR